MVLEANMKPCQKACQWTILCNRNKSKSSYPLLALTKSFYYCLRGLAYYSCYSVYTIQHIELVSLYILTNAPKFMSQLAVYPQQICLHFPSSSLLPLLSCFLPYFSSFCKYYETATYLCTWIITYQKVINLPTPFGLRIWFSGKILTRHVKGAVMDSQYDIHMCKL